MTDESPPRAPESPQAAGDGLWLKVVEAAPVGLTLSNAAGDVLFANSAAQAFKAARAEAAKPAVVERRAEIVLAGETYSVAASTDVGEQQALQDKLFHMAYFDALTGCPNRALFDSALADALSAPGEANAFAVVVFDMDRFRNVRDHYGHAVSDELLVKIARRANEDLGPNDLLARTGDDEFFLLIGQVREPEDAIAAAERILARLRDPFCAGGLEVFVSASAGLSLFPQHDQDGEGLRRKALTALSIAKRAGNGSVGVFDPEAPARRAGRARLEQNLRLALRDRQLFCAFQPKVDFRAGRIVGAEVLMRWRDADGNLRAPADVIALALNTGLMNEVTRLMFEQALGDLDRAKTEFGGDITLGFNIAASQAGDLAFMDSFVAMLRHSGQAHRFVIELTEEAFLQASRFQSHVLPMLREAGAKISIDDFGVGYSSLATLSEVTADEIKVDRAFIAAIHQRPRSQSVLRAIESIGDALGMSVMAEGVETAEELAYLVDHTAIRVAQGFYFGQPLTFEAGETRDDAGRSPHTGRARPQPGEPPFDAGARRRPTGRLTALGGSAPALALLRHVEIGQRPREGLGRHGEGLRQGRMGMDGEADVLGVAAHLDRQRRLGDQVAGVGADDAAADQPAARLVPQRLGQALVAPERQRAPARRPGEHRLAEGEPLGLGLRLGDADPGDFRIGIGDRRDRLGVEGGLVAARDLRRDLALVRRLVGEHRLADDVADREDMGNVGAHLPVDGDEAALVDRDPRGLGADRARRWAAVRPTPASRRTSSVPPPLALEGDVQRRRAWPRPPSPWSSSRIFS